MIRSVAIIKKWYTFCNAFAGEKLNTTLDSISQSLFVLFLHNFLQLQVLYPLTRSFASVSIATVISNGYYCGPKFSLLRQTIFVLL